MYDSANYMQNMLQTVCLQVAYLTPRQAGLGSWFRSLPLGVPGPFALATGSLQWDGLTESGCQCWARARTRPGHSLRTLSGPCWHSVVTVEPSGGVPQAVTQWQADRHGVTGQPAAPFKFRITQAGTQ